MFTKRMRLIMLDGLRRIHGGDIKLEDVPMPTPHHPRASTWTELIDAYLDLDGFQVNRFIWEEARLRTEDEIAARLQEIVDDWVASELRKRPSGLGNLDEALEAIKRMQARDTFRRLGPVPPMRLDKKIITPGHWADGPRGSRVWIEEEFEWVEPPRMNPPKVRRRRKKKAEEPFEIMGPPAAPTSGRKSKFYVGLRVKLNLDAVNNVPLGHPLTHIKEKSDWIGSVDSVWEEPATMLHVVSPDFTGWVDPTHVVAEGGGKRPGEDLEITGISTRDRLQALADRIRALRAK